MTRKLTLLIPASTIVALTILSAVSMLFARSDFDVHPRDLESRIDGEEPRRDTLWVDNDEGDAGDNLLWSLEVIADVEDWISAAPLEGEVPPGRGMNVVVVQHNQELDPGTYYAELVFSTNDPTRPEYIVPVAGHTQPYPTIITGWPGGWNGGWNLIDMNRIFGEIVWGEQYSFNLNFRNIGGASLQVEELVTSDGAWVLDPTTFEVAPGRGQRVRFTFTADLVDINSTTITSESNAWDPREIYFRITAVVQSVFRLESPLPDIEIEEDSEESLIADLDTVFISSDRGVEYETLAAAGLRTRIMRNGEFYLSPRRNWFGESEVVIAAMANDTTLHDTFLVDVTPTQDPPNAFDLLSPSHEDTLRWDDADSLFIWQTATDPDLEEVTYTLWVTADEGEIEHAWSDIPDTTLPITALEGVFDLRFGGEFNWTVSATDSVDTTEAWSTFKNYFVSTGVSKPEAPTPDSWRLIEVYPNPFNSTLRITVDLETENRLSVTVFDAMGRTVGELARGGHSSGVHVFSWQAGDLGSGQYVVQLQIGGKTQTRAVILSR